MRVLAYASVQERQIDVV